MRYTVVWDGVALAQLANLWMAATDRQAVTDSTDRIDSELAEDAHTKGVPIDPFWAFYDDPLAVLYEIEPGDCMARILQVRRTSP
jgi:hypothetical protein